MFKKLSKKDVLIILVFSYILTFAISCYIGHLELHHGHNQEISNYLDVIHPSLANYLYAYNLIILIFACVIGLFIPTTLGYVFFYSNPNKLNRARSVMFISGILISVSNFIIPYYIIYEMEGKSLMLLLSIYTGIGTILFLLIPIIFTSIKLRKTRDSGMQNFNNQSWFAQRTMKSLVAVISFPAFHPGLLDPKRKHAILFGWVFLILFGLVFFTSPILKSILWFYIFVLVSVTVLYLLICINNNTTRPWPKWLYLVHIITWICFFFIYFRVYYYNVGNNNV